MNTRLLLAALAGAVASFLAGWVIYGMAFNDFMDAQVLETAKGVTRTEPIMWALLVACFAWSLLNAYVFQRWANISTFSGGLKAGAVIGFLTALGADFFTFASLNYVTLNWTMVDSFLNAVLGALSGGAAGWTLGYKR